MVRAVRSWIPVVGLLALGAAACDQTAVTLPEATSLSVSPEAMSMVEGETSAVSAHVLDQRGQVLRHANASWSSSQPSVASVTADGMVEARSEGTATLTASYGGQTANVNVTVGALASTIAVSHQEAVVELNGSQRISARVLDHAGRPVAQPTMWTSDDESVAVVDQSGQIHGRAIGETTVRVHYGDLVREIPVQVTHRVDPEMEDFFLSQDEVTLYHNVPAARSATVGISAMLETGHEICPTFSATSSDEAVARVTNVSTGHCTITITGYIPGEATVTVTAGDFTEEIAVTVETADRFVDFFSNEPGRDEILAGETVSYSVTITDTEGEALVGQTVHFDVQRGTLAQTSVTTDEDGIATVEWTLPTNLSAPTTNRPWIRYRADLGDGDIREDHTWLRWSIAANDAATIEVRYEVDWTPETGTIWSDWMELDASATLETGRVYYFEMRSFDEYGNSRLSFGRNVCLEAEHDPATIDPTVDWWWWSSCSAFYVRSFEEQDGTVTVSDGEFAGVLSITFEDADDE